MIAREIIAAYLVAYVAVLSTVLGMLALVMVAHLTNATWFEEFRARAMGVIAALPVVVALGIIALVLEPVIRVDAPPGTSRALYMNPVFVAVRAIVYWVVWLAIWQSIRRTGERARRGDAKAVSRYTVVSSVGLVALALSMTFASFDWMMSLSRNWSSTVYGVYWFAGGAVGALAFLAIRPRSEQVLESPVEPPVVDLGKLTLTFILFWVYTGFAQYIVIWSGDIPHEVTWYVARVAGGWGWLALVILVGGVLVPFLALLPRRVRASPGLMAAIGFTLLAMHYLDTYWLIVPGTVSVGWLTVLISPVVLSLVIVVTFVVASWTVRRTVRA